VASGDCIFHITEAEYNSLPSSSTEQSSSANRALYALAMRYDGSGFVTGGADKIARFWQFILPSSSSSAGSSTSTDKSISQRLLAAECRRELIMPTEILSVRFSYHRSSQSMRSSTSDNPQKVSRSPLLVAFALLDHTVRIFYDDTLKLCLTCYGHSLPVMTLDISDDNTLLVTGSADKTVKLWGLDFGDCHRSLIAHEDAVTCVRFVPHTHFFFSTGKDGSLKYWDGDRYAQILWLPGHLCTIWNCELQYEGAVVCSVGADRSLRIWKRDTDDLVFLEEEEEKRLEAQVDQQAIRQGVAHAGHESEVVVMADGTTNITASTNANSAGLVAQSSHVSLKGSELLMQTIDLVEESLVNSSSDQVDAPNANPILLGLSPLHYLQRCLASQIPRPDLEAALLILPYHYVVRFLALLVKLAEHGMELEVCTRCVVFLLNIHHKRISHQSDLLSTLLALRNALGKSMLAYRNMIGVNLAGLKYMRQMIETDREEKESGLRVTSSAVSSLFESTALDKNDDKRQDKKEDLMMLSADEEETEEIQLTNEKKKKQKTKSKTISKEIDVNNNNIVDVELEVDAGRDDHEVVLKKLSKKKRKRENDY
jgi:U3 small nucleolar RNA-associated protein 12